MENSNAIPASPAVTVIAPPSGFKVLDLRELWSFRTLFWTLGVRDLKVRYKQTVLGATWVLLQPLLASGILTFVFGVVAGLEVENGPPMFLIAFSGMVIFTVFSRTLNNSSSCMVLNAHMVSKVYFPRIILPFSTVLTSLVNFVVAFIPLLIVVELTWDVPVLRLVWVPPLFVLAAALAMGAGLVTSALAVRFRDVQYVVPVAAQFLLFASPVAYEVAIVEQRVPQEYLFYYFLNPLVGVIAGFRWSVLGWGEFPAGSLVYSLCVAVVMFIIGGAVFHRLERNFADVI